MPLVFGDAAYEPVFAVILLIGALSILAVAFGGLAILSRADS